MNFSKNEYYCLCAECNRCVPLRLESLKICCFIIAWHRSLNCTENSRYCKDEFLCKSVQNGTWLQCYCKSGFKISNGTCVDIDECVEGPPTCDHICKNLHGSHKCECAKGYGTTSATHHCRANGKFIVSVFIVSVFLQLDKFTNYKSKNYCFPLY